MIPADLLRRLARLERDYERTRKLEIPTSGSGATLANVRAYMNSSQVIAHNTETIIDFDTVSYDPDGTITTGAAWHFTAPATGRYLVAISLHFEPATWADTDDTYAIPYVNGSPGSVLAELYVGITSARKMVNGTDVLALTSGDSLTFKAYQDSGSNKTLSSVLAETRINIIQIA